MWTIIKLTLGVLVLVACFQAGRVALNNYQFEDAVSQAILFGSNVSDADIVRQVLEIADEYDVPLEASNVTVRRERRDLFVDMEYTEDVALIPGVYTKAWTFKPRATARVLNPTR
jgi:hypothetical protein